MMYECSSLEMAPVMSVFVPMSQLLIHMPVNHVGGLFQLLLNSPTRKLYKVSARGYLK